MNNEVNNTTNTDTSNQNNNLGYNIPTNADNNQVNNVINNMSSNEINNPNIGYNVIPNDNPPIKKGNKKKWLFIIGGILLLIIAFIIGYNLLKKDKPKHNPLFEEDTLIKVKKDDKYGYINTEGEFVIKPIYIEADDFNGDYAVVKIAPKDDKEMPYKVINNKGEIKAEVASLYSIEYYPKENVWLINEALYNSSLKKLSPDNVKVLDLIDGYLKWENKDGKSAGIMNTEGKIVYTYKFKDGEYSLRITPSVTDKTLKERYCIVTIDYDKNEIVNCDTGKVVYKLTNENIANQDNNIFKTYEDSSYNYKSLIYIQDDKIAYETNDKNVRMSYNLQGYVIIDDGGKRSYLNVETGKIGSDMPKDLNNDELTEWELLTGITKKKCDDGYGLVKNNDEVLACKWDKIEYLDNDLYEYLLSKDKNYVIAQKDDKTSIINLDNGKVVKEFDTISLTINNESTFIYYYDVATNKKIIYNLVTEKSLKSEVESYIDPYANYVVIKDNNKRYYYNTDFKLIYVENA